MCNSCQRWHFEMHTRDISLFCQVFNKWSVFEEHHVQAIMCEKVRNKKLSLIHLRTCFCIYVNRSAGPSSVLQCHNWVGIEAKLHEAEDLSWKIYLLHLIFLILLNGEVILSISCFTIRYVGWKIKVQLEVGLIFYCMSREKIIHGILSLFLCFSLWFFLVHNYMQ